MCWGEDADAAYSLADAGMHLVEVPLAGVSYPYYHPNYADTD